jgi:serine/threonine protein kinase
LLGHGQFGYTYVATDKGNGDRVAVKRIDKNKVLLLVSFIILWTGVILWFLEDNN